MSARSRNGNIQPFRLGFALFLLAGTLAAEEIDREFHRAFDVAPGMSLRLEHGDGDVVVTPWEQDSLDIHVRYRAKATNLGWTRSTEFDVEFRQSDDTIHVIGREPSRVSIGVSAYRQYEYSYTVRAPSYLALVLEGEDGDVEIEDWRGAIAIDLEDGDVRLTAIDSPHTRIALEDGDLKIDGLRGALEVMAEDGDVQITDCQSDDASIRVEDGDVSLGRCGGNLRLQASDGSVRLSRFAAERLDISVEDGVVELGLRPSGNLALTVRTSDGNVILDLDPEIAASFTLETGDGALRVDATEVHELRQEAHRLTGRLGDGRGSIRITTDDGDVTLRQ